MNVARRQPRTESRKQRALPYAHRKQQPKSSWSVFSSVLNYFNPLKSTEARDEASSEEPEQNMADESFQSREENFNPAQNLSERGQELAHDLSLHGRSNAQAGPSAPPPRAQATSTQAQTPNQAFSFNFGPTPNQSPSRQQIYQGVTSLIQQKGDKPLSRNEHEEIIYQLKAATQEDEGSFHFQSTPTTPARGNSPFTHAPLTLGQTQTPRRMLSKNPNGPYQFNGVASAKRTPSSGKKQRYQSPGFGTPRHVGSVKLSVPPMPELPKVTDNKRRRVGESKEDFKAQTGAPPNMNIFPFPVSNVTSPSPVKANNPSTPQVSTSSKLPRINVTTLPPRASTPAHPSPLRQAWNQSFSSSSSSPRSNPPSPPPNASVNGKEKEKPKQTESASYLLGVIEQVTPLKKPDVVNPYQAASPLPTKKAKPAVNGRKRIRATGKPLAPPASQETEIPKEVQTSAKEKEKAVTAQAIIEATLPKGATRSRPPANLEKSFAAQSKPRAQTNGDSSSTLHVPPTSPTLRRSPRNQATPLPPINGDSSPKKGKGPPSITVEEIDELEDDYEEDNRAAKKQRKSPKTILNGFTVPPPPSRANGVTKDKATVPPPPVTVEEIMDEDAPLFAQPLRPAEIIEVPEGGESDTSSRGAASSQGSRTTPAGVSNLFGVPVHRSVPRAPSKLRMSFQAEVPPPVPFTTEEPAPAPAPAPQATPIAEPPSYASTSKLTPTPTPADPKEVARSLPVSALPVYTFTFSTSISSVAHGKVREAVKRLPTASLPKFNFPLAKPGSTSTATTLNWAGVPVKSTDAGTAQWSCGTCGLKNPASVTDKCTICEAPKVSAPAPAAAPPVIFNWAAVPGFKPKGDANGEWSCGTCGLKNPANVTDKCTICDAPKISKPATTVPSVGFNWAAAPGFKPKGDASTEWSCGTCGLKNPNTASEKCTICDAPKVSAPVAAPTPAATFNWVAAPGFKPKAVVGGEWTCGTCGLKNPSSATTKCTICDGAR